MKRILFPFVNENDFKAGYAWSLDLAERLKGRLSIFTTTTSIDMHIGEGPFYEWFADAQVSFGRLGPLPLDKKPKSVVRHFMKGDFESTLLRFIEKKKFDVLVLPSSSVTESALSELIHSRKQIINLPSSGIDDDTIERAATREALFLEILYRAACYNLPSSFYKSFGDDKSLFNSIASFFKRPELDISKLTAG